MRAAKEPTWTKNLTSPATWITSPPMPISGGSQIHVHRGSALDHNNPQVQTVNDACKQFKPGGESR